LGDNLSSIASSVGGQREATNELSTTTAKAAGAVTSVSEEVSAIGADIDTTSSGASQMTSASLELSRLATELRMQVEEFLKQIR